MNEQGAKRLPPVGRDAEKRLLSQIILGPDTVILYLEGDAGIGKTTVLEVAASLADLHNIICVPIVDFYDTRMHSYQGVEAALIDALDPAPNGTFAEYRLRRQLHPQAELWEDFRRGYETALRMKGRRALLRFDTAERLVYERDSEEVLRDCEVEETAAPSWQWLLRRIGDLPQTTVVIAARPSTMLRERLKQVYGDRLLHHQITGFSVEETKAYFAASPFGAELMAESPDIVEKVHQLSKGRPILIALALDWLSRGDWDRSTLEAIEPGIFEQMAVEQVRSLKTPLDRAIKYAALCRKGCNAKLLSLLMRDGGYDVTEQEAEQLVAQLHELSFVKPIRPGSEGMFFLHDEMYELVEKYVWLVEWPDYREQARLDRTIINWYDVWIKTCKQRSRQEEQLALAERLYYQFDENPRLGYREYSHLTEEAIGSRELQWDVWLRNEMLWFTEHRHWRQGGVQPPDSQGYPREDPARIVDGKLVRSPLVEYDSRRFWVGRFIAEGNLEKAALVAEKLLGRSRECPDPNEPRLYRCGIQISLAIAQTYMGGELTESALKNFREAIEALELLSDRYNGRWLYTYLLGTAYLYLGLALTNSLRLSQAVKANARAITLFTSIDSKARLAEALNNQSYVFVRRGRSEEARFYCEKGLAIRQELGDQYEIGLSLNTKGIINERLDRPLTAIYNSELALSTFKAIGNVRGMILANINLGRSYRRKARSPEWGRQDADFEQGLLYLKDALSLQESLGRNADMFYRLEAYNEIGCLYRDWAGTLLDVGGRAETAVKHLQEAASYLEAAIALMTDPEGRCRPGHEVMYIDCLEDYARVCYLLAKATSGTEAKEHLRRMTKLLDEAESEATRLREEQELWEERELLLGKICFQRARLALLEDRKDDAARYFARAAGHTENYSIDAPELRKFVADAVEWLSGFSAIEAKQYIERMYSSLEEYGLLNTSKRLERAIESVVFPILEVGWPKRSTGA